MNNKIHSNSQLTISIEPIYREWSDDGEVYSDWFYRLLVNGELLNEYTRLKYLFEEISTLLNQGEY